MILLEVTKEVPLIIVYTFIVGFYTVLLFDAHPKYKRWVIIIMLILWGIGINNILNQ